MDRFCHRLLLLSLLALLTANCDRSIPAPDFSGEWVGYGAIADNRLLPIRAFLNLNPDSLSGYFTVAGEITNIPEMTLWADSLRLDFAEYGAAMVGRLDGERFNGQYFRFWKDTTSFPFVLFRNPEEELEPVPDSSTSGTYRVIVGGGENVNSSSIATLNVENGMLTGTVIDPSGDYGLLEGKQGNGTITLFRFTGWQALYFELTESQIGYRGRFQVRAEPAQDVAFIRTESDAREIERATEVKHRNRPFLFSGLTATGEIVTSQDKRFAGKPLVIDIMGTWCHNCQDAAPLLQHVFEIHAADSLQVVSLAFEVHDDAVNGLKNLERFRDRFGITYPILYCGSLEEENVAARLRSQLEDFFSYPTTIFIDRAGKVTEIHTGFNGPGAGRRWEEQIAEFEAAVNKIVSS
jgi:thiol-disulfide isomerase/thioredoxin